MVVGPTTPPATPRKELASCSQEPGRVLPELLEPPDIDEGVEEGVEGAQEEEDGGDALCEARAGPGPVG